MPQRKGCAEAAAGTSPRGAIGMYVRFLWLTLGLLATASGLAGAVLPLVPTTPFLLVAAYAFARSSPRLHCWLLEHPRFGRLIRNWQDHGGIDPRAKALAVIAMAGTFGLSWLLGVSDLVLAVQATVLAAAALFVLTRPNGPKE